jgi:hypothetical protein
MSDSFYAERLVRQVKIAKIAAIASSPPVLTGWEPQYQEIRAIAREAKHGRVF